MPNMLRKIGSAARYFFRRSLPSSKVGRLAFWLVPLYLLLWLADWRHHAGTLTILRWIDALLWIVLLCILLLRWARRRLLWSLRNKLVLTYLLIGLTPVVLFLALAGFASYVLTGQFAIHLASARMQAVLDRMEAQNETYGDHIARILSMKGAVSAVGLAPLTVPELSVEEASKLHAESRVAVLLNGIPLAIAGQPAVRQPDFTVPAWAIASARRGFHGIVLDNGQLYLRAITRETYSASAGMHSVVVVNSIPVDEKLLNTVANGLGAVAVSSSFIPGDNVATGRPFAARRTRATHTAPESDVAKIGADERTLMSTTFNEISISGGSKPKPVNLFDRPVHFETNERISVWATGNQGNIALYVDSIPSLLYRQLFDTSLLIATVFRFVFIGVCIFFAVLEIFALIMALRLSRIITRSIADLYQATQRIDHGDFEHRIRVRRHDQLAGLNISFNNMTESLQRLLIEQREKERLQNELSIAQEVQANLFPHRFVSLPTLELHGVCRPARIIGGDYYDFLYFYGKDSTHTAPAGVGIALGDISGKGISAALLMATLHSAIRAYSFANEELVYTESIETGLSADHAAASRPGARHDLIQSPARIQSLVNRHLYCSTQPEKYATLFLAYYEVATSQLTYSNAGHLPPLVLGADGSVRRLDCGGTVVGLLDHVHYDEAVVQLRSGDIVVAYSDGITEPENEFGEFGEQRLLDIVRQHRDEPLDVISAKVMLALQLWIGTAEQPDDITLVLARQA